jgi:hypothetical protein
MRRQQDLRAEQCRRPHILHDVVVEADQDPDADTPRRVEDRVAVAIGDAVVPGGMQLVVDVHGAVRQAYRVGVEQPTVAFGEQPGAHTDVEPLRQRAEPGDRRAVFGLRESAQVLGGASGQVPVADQAQFGEGNEPHGVVGRGAGEVLNPREVVLSGAGTRLELDGCDSDHHGSHRTGRHFDASNECLVVFDKLREWKTGC